MNKVKLDEHWTLDAGFGEAQRPPTLMERYSDGLFVSTLQSGFTHMVGNVDLRPERDWQFDVGLGSNYDYLHTKARFFQAWIQDYVTYAGSNVSNPLTFLDARLLYFTNTRLATLTGFETAADYDWSENLTPFAKMSYVYGWDQEINAPLTGISPWKGRSDFAFTTRTTARSGASSPRCGWSLRRTSWARFATRRSQHGCRRRGHAGFHALQLPGLLQLLEEPQFRRRHRQRVQRELPGTPRSPFDRPGSFANPDEPARQLRPGTSISRAQSPESVLIWGSTGRYGGSPLQLGEGRG